MTRGSTISMSSRNPERDHHINKACYYLAISLPTRGSHNSRIESRVKHYVTRRQLFTRSNRKRKLTDTDWPPQLLGLPCAAR